MAMPKDLAKVQKRIQKKKGATTSLHEDSRDAKRLRRAGARSDKLEKLAAARGKALQPYHEAQTAQRSSGYRYLNRDSTELSTIQSERRPGRPTSTTEDMLKQRIRTEANEYKSGYWIPDMEDVQTLERLKEWNEQWTSLGSLKYVRLAKDGTKRYSTFPPKGKS
ncbi:MAG: hypothetical protein LQ337_003961 [Flavoplaca oasis]|nr:MAG: hypothetical protein LQ337_003961 [Flavoplaca oasis]